MTQPPVEPPAEPDEPIGGALTPPQDETPEPEPDAPEPGSTEPTAPAGPAPSGATPPAAGDYPPPPPAPGSYPPPPPPVSGGYPPPPPRAGLPGGYPPAPPEGVYPPAYAVGPGGMPLGAGMKPNRGGLVLALGIVGLLCCGPVSIVAYIMGKNDLAAMIVGQMDPSGRSNTNIGRILGIVGMVFLVLQIVWIAFSWQSLGT